MRELIDALLKKSKELRLKRLCEIAKSQSEDKVLEGLNIINLKRKNEKILRACFDNLDLSLNDQYHPRKPSLSQLVIEVTQNCNMRCKYCIYGEYYLGERNYSSAVISRDAAFKAIKYFLDNPGHPEPNITFFGGEPLLNQNLIEDCLKYARQINPKTKFFMTTNGLLLNPISFDFIRRYQIEVGVSLDGPKDIHDSCRVLPCGEGSFDVIEENIAKLYQIDSDYLKNHFRLLITLTDITNLKAISDFLRRNRLFNNFSVTINKVRTTGLRKSKEFNGQMPEYEQIKSILNGYVRNYKKDILESVSAEHAYFSPLLALISKRKALKEKFSFTKVCVLGDLRLFVDVNGNFRICEKTDRLPIIGNVNRGIDWDLIDSMKRDFLSTYGPCRSCWAINVCNVCWLDIYNNYRKVDQSIKNSICKTKLEEYKMGLRVFVALAENYGESFGLTPR